MTQPDYRGARGSNAGDDFHELWVVRQALALLEDDARLSAITVEGLREIDERGTSRDTWDGVDCALYYGGEDSQSAQRIEIVQVKYSAASPEQPWTISRLTRDTRTKGKRSVLGKLAEAFVTLKGTRPDLAASGNLAVRFISNQPVHPDVLRSIAETELDLSKTEFDAFVNSLDLTECGGSSRFSLEECIILRISAWVGDDASNIKTELMMYVRKMMMPEGKGQYITRQSILTCFGFSDASALFPCPTVIEKVENLVPRQVSKELCERMLSVEQFVCLHGEAGCGKTTVLQDLESLLPPGSATLVFDCYGGGRYLNANSLRHRVQDAFLQLSNDLARQLRIPLLVSRWADSRKFMTRLEKAADVVCAIDPKAMLVIAIDAADNSVIAADSQSPPEKSFVHEFVRLGPLPGNVRFIVTTRTGRLASLKLPRYFVPMEMQAFTRAETAAHVRNTWREAWDIWIDDFHQLSNGNPRVQQYAMKFAGVQPSQALDYLHPHGKVLNQIFREHFETALRKEGGEHNIKLICAGLVEFPRPIPIQDLSKVTALSEPHVRDICGDLSPGVRLTNDSIEFADEDFEQFVRIEAKDQLSLIRNKIADHFTSRYESDAYAAAHFASALFKANRKQQIVALVRSEPVPSVIRDPVLRRATQLQRLRIAMKVCREAGSNVDAMSTLLVGAEALKTNAVLDRMFTENPDLTASFAHDTAARAVLRNPDEIENHGRILFHLLAADARRGDALSVREGRRLVLAWLQRRADHLDEDRKKHPGFEPTGWKIDDDDIVAETEAALRVVEPSIAVKTLLRWRPRSLAFRVATSLANQLLTSGEASLLKSCLTSGAVASPWDIFLLVPLALAGEDIDLSKLALSVCTLQRRRLIRIDRLQNTIDRSDPMIGYLDTIVTACEICIARGGNRSRILPVLEEIAAKEIRRRDQLRTSNPSLIEICLRAHALIESTAGRKTTIETFWVDPPGPDKNLAPDKLDQIRKADSDRREELRNLVEPIADIYNVRAQAIVGSILPEEVEANLKKAISRFQGEHYRFRRQFSAQEMVTLTSLAIARLMELPGLDRRVILECSSTLTDLKMTPPGKLESQIFGCLALDRSLHPEILEKSTRIAGEIRNLKIPAEEKIEAIVRLSRLLLHISESDAQILFNEAIDVASEVNTEAIHEIRVFEPLAEQGAGSMTVEASRATACYVANIVSDAAARLSGQEQFPWREAAQSIACLDVCIALAATARWDDSGVVTYGELLPHIFRTGLARQTLSPSQVVSLASLIDVLGIDLLDQILERGKETLGESVRRKLADEIARDELLMFVQPPRKEVVDGLNLLVEGNSPSLWTGKLVRTANFVHNAYSNELISGDQAFKKRQHDQCSSKKADPFDGVNWEQCRFVSSFEIESMIHQILEKAKVLETYVSTSAVLDKIAGGVALGDRVSHLKALTECEGDEPLGFDLAAVIDRRLKEWGDSPSVQEWCRTDLLRLIADRLPVFAAWISHGQSLLPAMLKQSCSPNKDVFDALLQGMEQHVESLDAPTVYALVGLAVRYCPSNDAARLLVEYVYRLFGRIELTEREAWDLSDIPTESHSGIARFLYALMGDVDVRIRWRAAHALRRLARLGNTKEVDEIISFYSRTSESSYRDPKSPFYWLAARLWLVIALCRIAHENPTVLGALGPHLFKISVDKDVPHLLIRSFAKQAVLTLVKSRVLRLVPSQLRQVKMVNTSPVRKKKRLGEFRLGSDRTDKKSDRRRFQFDMTDTLPYWYNRVISCFADLTMEEFLDAAERWIVDQWQVKAEVWRWDLEPRPNRFRNGYLLTDHRHGSRPTLERFDRYLEWHAMFCATGELLQSKPLALGGIKAYDSLSNWLEGEGLATPPWWMSDLRGVKPLERRLWLAPQVKIDNWVDGAKDDDFLLELGLVNNNDMLIVQSSHYTQSRTFSQSVRVRSAFVSRSTAGALVRALQTIANSWDYKIPDSGDMLEIDEPPYRLLGWLDDVDHGTGIDEHDPLRNGVRDIECRPTRRITKAMKLKFLRGDQPMWTDQHGRGTVFLYDVWSEFPHSEGDERYWYEEMVRSSGWRLLAHKAALRSLLRQMNFDLIVEVEITRRNRPYGDSRYYKEKTKEAIFDKVILLKKDGEIEAAEGCIGTWTPPSA